MIRKSGHLYLWSIFYYHCSDEKRIREHFPSWSYVFQVLCLLKQSYLYKEGKARQNRHHKYLQGCSKYTHWWSQAHSEGRNNTSISNIQNIWYLVHGMLFPLYFTLTLYHMPDSLWSSLPVFLFIPPNNAMSRVLLSHFTDEETDDYKYSPKWNGE